MVFLTITQKQQVDQDDSSISSTLTVDRFDAKTEQNAGEYKLNKAGQFKGKKYVSFNKVDSYNTNTEILSFDECKAVWYNAQDYREFKALAQDSSQQILRIESRNRAPFSYQRVMETSFNACIQATNDIDEVLPSSELIHLHRWIEVASSRCGLEKWSVRKVSKDRSTRRHELTNTVKSIQGNTIRYENGLAYTNDNKSELIRNSCENISRPSRLYAQILAQGLAAAVIKENQQ